LRGVLADRPGAVTALTRIFLDDIERWFGAAVAVPDAAARPSLCPRFGAVSFLHRFGSALNRHVHLHACVTDGLFRSRPESQGAEFLPARPVTPARGPPTAWAELVLAHDDRDAIQASPEDLSVIDICSR